MTVDGDVQMGFGGVADAFERNFDVLGEIGAEVAVYHRGRLVVDLAAGTDPVGNRPFTRETLMMVASCTKGATATCVLMLADAGVLDLDAPVTMYWPEFGQAGKAEIPLRWVLAHQAGLPYPDPEAELSGLDISPVPGSSASSNAKRRGGHPGPRSPTTRSRPAPCSARSCGA